MISVNETGFLPSAVKLAISDSPGSFRLIDDTDGKPIDIGVAVIDSGFDETAGCEVYRLDFSGVSAPGIYHLESDDGICSAAFKVEPHVYKTLKNSLLKSFYFQRCGCGLQEEYAGCCIYYREMIGGAVDLDNALDDRADCQDSNTAVP